MDMGENVLVLRKHPVKYLEVKGQHAIILSGGGREGIIKQSGKIITFGEFR